MPLQIYKIASTTVTASAGVADITFSNIPQGYTDIYINFSPRSNRTDFSSDNIRMTFNGDTGNNYSVRRLEGSGSAASSDNNASTSSFLLGYADGDTMTASVFGSTFIYVPNYAGSTNKSVSFDGVTENNATFSWTFLSAGLWANTAAITSLKLFPQVGTAWKQYTTATLYGVL